MRYFRDELDINVESLSLSRLQGAFMAKKLVARYVQQNRVSLVHSQGIRSDSQIAASLLTKSVSTLRNFPPHDYPQKNSEHSRKIDVPCSYERSQKT